ncbi:MAG: tRNA pseudouridine(38-40) synthase TruA [Planctomycetota bacterium]|nr:tRNA pseudouridine(38-40) synthase TruA [Planctomycetota bacterium]
MRNVRLLVAYDGSRFFGWQRQDGFDSVQQSLEEAVLAATGQRATVHGAGRTDTGVHALGQVASLHLDTRLTDDRLRHALNAHLPPGVVVREAETCADDFHARFSAVSKRYAYHVVTSRFAPAFGCTQTHWISWPLDVPRMRRAASALLGTHDFAAFGNTGSPRATTVRTVRHLRFVARRERFFFVIQGDGFLYNMVRTIAGTLIDVGRGKIDEGACARALESRERDDAGFTAAASGLYLVSVQYPERPFAGRRTRS